MHYCQNELKDFSFFLETDSCSKEIVKIPCPMHKGMEIEMESKKGCCDDETHYSKITTEQEAQSFQVELLTDFLLIGILPSNESTRFDLILKPDHYLNYKPPLLICDVQARLQIFLC